MLRWFGQAHGFPLRGAARYFNVAGALPGRGEEHEPESHLIPLVLDVALGLRLSIAIFGDDLMTRRMAPASAITFTSPIWRRRTSWPCTLWRSSRA